MALILIVDDSPTEVHVFQKALERHGYKTATATDGAEGVRMAREIRPDLIFMDIDLPGMNGMEAAALLRGYDAMTPLVFAILRALTPASIATTLIDERIEPFAPVATDLVAITVETFTARRAYEIADAYRARGVTVVMGGHHPYTHILRAFADYIVERSY